MSPSETECLEAGGTFDRDGGQVSCEILDPVGNSANSGGQSQSTTETESSNGTLNNRPKHEEDCIGPGNSGSGRGPCP